MYDHPPLSLQQQQQHEYNNRFNHDDTYHTTQNVMQLSESVGIFTRQKKSLDETTKYAIFTNLTVTFRIGRDFHMIEETFRWDNQVCNIY